MEERRNSAGKPHGLVLRGRRSIALTGVRDVLSYDETEVALDTEMGLLQIRGKEMKVKRVTVESGEVDLEGQIDSLEYSASADYHGRKKESLLKRMLK